MFVLKIRFAFLVFCLLAMVLSIMSQSCALAAVHFMDNDPNYPATYYHANYREYVDLSSCDWNNTLDDYDVYSAGYIAYTFSPEGEG